VLPPDCGEIGVDADLLLALAVVTELDGFEDAGKTDGEDGLAKVALAGDDAERTDGEAAAEEEFLLAAAILGGVEDVATGAEGDAGGEGVEGFDGDVFEFVGDDVDAAGELQERGDIGVGGVVLAVGDLAGGAVGRGIDGVDAVAHFTGGESEHAAELATAEAADGGAGENGGGLHAAGVGGSFWARTFFV
jgi:hypothetical protein